MRSNSSCIIGCLSQEVFTSKVSLGCIPVHSSYLEICTLGFYQHTNLMFISDYIIVWTVLIFRSYLVCMADGNVTSDHIPVYPSVTGRWLSSRSSSNSARNMSNWGWLDRAAQLPQSPLQRFHSSSTSLR